MTLARGMLMMQGRYWPKIGLWNWEEDDGSSGSRAPMDWPATELKENDANDPTVCKSTENSSTGNGSRGR